MDKTCENCRFWKVLVGDDVKRCERLIIDSRGRQTDNPIRASPFYAVNIFCATFPSFGCNWWERHRCSPFHYNGRSIEFSSEEDYSCIPDHDIQRIVAWLNELWQKYKETETPIFSVQRLLPDKRGLEYQSMVHFGYITLEIGQRWFTEEAAKEWLETLERACTCQP